MAIDLLKIQPSVVSRDLKGKFVEIYGPEKVGKTTIASSFPNLLLCGFEHGWNALNGVYGVDILKWADFKKVVKQLQTPEVQARYDTVGLDTIGIAWNMCVEYICTQENVDKLSDIPYGGGWDLAAKEFEKTIRIITQLGYGIVIIAHSASRFEDVGENGATQEIFYPDIPKKARSIVNRLVDIIAFIENDDNGNRWLITRKTPTITAGSRFKYLAAKIPLDYDSLVNEIGEAIEKEAQEKGVKTTELKVTTPIEEDKVDFDDTVRQIKAHAVALKNADKFNLYNKVAEEYLGKGKKVSECDESQIDMLVLILDDLKDIVKENELEV